ncbi:MAG: hypothetical protein HY527_18675 [Betaproteobacteria bacterium]|nr:hypothetical protein [Betaproteobacteria bacterium]
MAAKTAFAGLISKSGLKKLAGERYFERGLDYFEGGAVVHLRLGEDGIFARVQGTEPCPYAVRFWLEKQELEWGCSCPLGIEGEFCKHLVAAGLAWLSGDLTRREPDIPEDLQTIQGFLEAIDKETLVELLTQRAVWDEYVLAELALAARASRHEDAEKRPRHQGRETTNKAENRIAKPRK